MIGADYPTVNRRIPAGLGYLSLEKCVFVEVVVPANGLGMSKDLCPPSVLLCRNIVELLQ